MVCYSLRALTVVIGIVASGGGFAAAADPLAGTQWRERVLLVVADRPDDPGIARQRAIFDRMEAAARERDLRLIVVAGTEAPALAIRRRFALPQAGFEAVLVGKDGGAKLRSITPLGAEALLPTIDAMPMRRDEMRRRS